jgi:hypothetical protein
MGAHEPHTMRLGAGVGALTMCAMAVAPRELARAASAASAAPAGGPAPIYVVCSPSRRVGKTLMARCLTEYHVADGRAVAAYDLSDEGPQLTDYLPHHAAIADIADIRGQMALFDGLIADDEMPKVIDVGHRAFWRFFAVVHRIGFFDEARRRGIEPVVLFMIDTDPKTEKACTLLRCSFPDTPLLQVRNLAVAKDGEAFRHEGDASTYDAGADEASALAARLEITELPSSLRSLVDRPGFSFADFPQRSPVPLSASAHDELLGFIRRIYVQLRDVELGLVSERPFAGLQ